MAVRDIIQAAAGVGGGGEYVEDVFSTYVYTGDGTSTKAIVNGIDLDGEGGLVWIKGRSNADSHMWSDTNRGLNKILRSQVYNPETTTYNVVKAFNSDGFTIGNDSNVNGNGKTYVSWTLRKSPKFFDILTYTGDGTTGRQIPHNLESVPGCIIVKATSAYADWYVYHKDVETAKSLKLNFNYTPDWNAFGTPTDTHFVVGSSASIYNASGVTYVAYLFAHDAGGFGDDGEQNIISCGSFTTDGSGNATVDLGFEPQWLMTKSTNTTGNWVMVDVMRGWAQENNQNILKANLSDAEAVQNSTNLTNITSTGLQNYLTYLGANNTYIYIAIRRPMKTPESGTEVFSPVARTGTSANATVTAGFAPDAIFASNRDRSYTNYNPVFDKLRGINALLTTNGTGAEQSLSGSVTGFTNTGFTVGSDAYGNLNGSGGTYINWILKRAPGFFDMVAYTGTGSGTTVAHNLGVAPELIIVKNRVDNPWTVYSSTLGATKYLALHLSDSATVASDTIWNLTEPTTSNFSVGTFARVNSSGAKYIAYLFASCPGVSKVGSYVGTGANLNVDCGFSAGARFVLIKRTDSTGDWYVWDSARGIVAGNDPYLLLNSTAAEVTSTDYIDPLASGFTITSSAPAALNASGGSYIFLAIA